MTTRFSATRVAALAVLASLAVALPGSAALAAEAGPEIARQKWTFTGFNGYFDNAQLQRGFQVYEKVCASCHGLKRLSFRNLAEKGGPEFPEEAVKAFAAEWPNQIFDGPNDQGRIADSKGNVIKRPARLSDPILGPYDNDQAARAAQKDALPPDLSLIAKARSAEHDKPFWRVPDTLVREVLAGYQEGGPDYVYSLLTGYGDVPAYRKQGEKLVAVAAGGGASVLRCASVTRGEGAKPDVCNTLGKDLHYNAYFPGHQISMQAPLVAGAVRYGDGTQATAEQYARDVTAFLAWAADPKLEERKFMGRLTIAYLLLTAILLYFAKRRTWARAH